MKGETHRITIPSILEVGKGNINIVGSLIKKVALKKVSIYFGEGIHELFGMSIETSIKESNIDILQRETITNIDFEDIGVRAFENENDVDAFVGIGGGKIVIDDFAVMLSKKAVNSFARTEFKTIKDDLFLKELVDSLTLNGIAMEIASNSSPASGSEHLISHALDKLLEVPELHGIQVGIAAYIMAKVQNNRWERITKVFNETGF